MGYRDYVAEKADRITWMFKVADCHGICLFCRWFNQCRTEGTGKEVRKVNMKYAKRSEDTEQIIVIQWAQANTDRHPELKWLHHCPNGGSRNRNEAVKFKQMGVKAGVSDLCLPYPKGIYCGLYIEMKFGDNKQTENQKEFLEDMAAAGHYVATCYSAREAVEIITEYLSLNGDCFQYGMLLVEREHKRDTLGHIEMNIPNNSVLKGGDAR